MKKVVMFLVAVLALVLTGNTAMAQESEHFKLQPMGDMQATEMSSENVRTGLSFWETGKDSRTHVNHFWETYASIGGWKGPNTYGAYALPEILKWRGPEHKTRVENYGLGLIVKFDSGASDFGPEWGYLAPGIEGGFWKNFNDEWYLLMKPRITYRFNREESDRADGVMPGMYAEASTVLSPRDLLMVAADGWYFPEDSYASLRIHWEHKFGAVKTMLGVGPVWHILDTTTVGISPSGKIKLSDTWSLIATVDFSKGGPFYGVSFSHEYNSDRHNALERVKRIQQ